jgi:hypothetical protein
MAFCKINPLPQLPESPLFLLRQCYVLRDVMRLEIAQFPQHSLSFTFAYPTYSLSPLLSPHLREAVCYMSCRPTFYNSMNKF